MCRRRISWMYAMLLFTAIFLINLISSLVGAERTAVVNTTYGPVQGEILTTVVESMRYASFRGIRYAKPPLGWLRFQPPIPIDPWDEVFDATIEGPDCIQTGKTNANIQGSEDCLFLNVFTPVTDLEETPTELKAVMIWIYGGAWRKGTSKVWIYGPDFLVEKDVVLVSFNHRVGVLGFLNLNLPNATGNAGLKDQRLVFQWVQENIEKFGGNPNNVTVFGDSSGGMSAQYHTLSERSAGLFHAVIAMSASPLVPWAFQTAATVKQRSEELGGWLGINSTDPEILLEAFYNTSAAELAMGAFWIKEVIAFSPTIENASIATEPVFTECFLKSWYTGNFIKIPQMLGFLDLEIVPFACLGVEAYMTAIQTHIEMSELMGFEIPDSIYEFKEIYDAGAKNWSEYNSSLIQETLRVTSDLIFISPIDLTQQILVAHNDDQPIYYYHISFDYPQSIHIIQWKCTFQGPGHGDDLAYLFRMPIANYSLDLSDPLARTRARVSTLWTNFAKYGNPTPDWVDDYNLNITWPASELAGISLEIGNELSIVPRPITENRRLIESYAWPVLPQVADCN